MGIKKMETIKETKKAELAQYLDVNIEAIKAVDFDESLFAVDEKEYLVLTNQEAQERTEQEISQLLWAFRPEFLINYIDVEIDESDRKTVIESIRNIQEEMCESANAIITLLVKNKLKQLMDDAIVSDGRGHFLATWDGKEEETEHFFIYRVN